MVSSKKVHCAYCQKKCSGNVLRYQDQYYHKQCFELEQSEALAHEAASAASGEDEQHPAATSGGSLRPELYIESGEPPQEDNEAGAVRAADSRSSTTSLRQRLSHSSTSQQQHQTTRIFTTHSQSNLQHNNSQAASQSSNLQAAGRQPYEETNSLGKRSASSSRQNLPTAPTASDFRMSSPSSEQTTMGRTIKSHTIDARQQQPQVARSNNNNSKAATLPHSISSPANGFVQQQSSSPGARTSNKSAPVSRTTCAGCREKISDGQALIALDLHWHVWCFKCAQCKAPLHGEYVAKDNSAYCEKDYQKLFGITCVYCKRYITGKVLQAGEAHHFHPSCARCSKCGEPFVPGEEMYLQGEVTWHPRCGPGPNSGFESSLGLDADDRSTQLRASRAQSPSMSSRSRSRSASPFSYMSRQYGRASPAYADSEAVGDLSRVYTISYLNADPNQGYLRRPIEPNAPKSPQFSRPTSLSRLGGGGGGGGGTAASDRSRCSSRSQPQQHAYSSGRERSVPRGMYSVLSSMRSGSSSRARSPSMMNEEAIQLAAYPSGQKPSPDSVPKIERDDFPAPPFPYPERHQHQQRAAGQSTRPTKTDGGEVAADGESTVKSENRRLVESRGQERASRPRSREIVVDPEQDPGDSSSNELDPQFRKEEEELSKIANGIGKIFLQTLKEREKLRAWKRSNLDPRNASRTPSATRELPSRLRYDNPTTASPSRDLDRPRPWEEDELYGINGEHSPTRTRSSLGRPATANQAAGGASSSAISSAYGYKVVQSSRSTPRPGYGLTSGPYEASNGISSSHLTAFIQGEGQAGSTNGLSFAEQQRVAQTRAADLLGRPPGQKLQSEFGAPNSRAHHQANSTSQNYHTSGGSMRSLASAAHFRRSMPNVANLHHLHAESPPKLYPYHLLATSNYRLPPDVDRCHLERHLSNEEFHYIFHCDRLDFYRLPEWKRNELKRRARLF